jgi:hypothetical protein
MDMRDKSTPVLRRRRTLLLQQLPPPPALLRGSLIERYKRCGKPGCHCADGPGHGPKYYLSISRSGARPQMDYVPQSALEEVRTALANYQDTREMLEELCAINRELLRRRERL